MKINQSKTQSNHYWLKLLIHSVTVVHPPSSRVILEQIAQDWVQTALEYLKWRRLQSLSGQPVQVFCDMQIPVTAELWYVTTPYRQLEKMREPKCPYFALYQMTDWLIGAKYFACWTSVHIRMIALSWDLWNSMELEVKSQKDYTVIVLFFRSQ